MVLLDANALFLPARNRFPLEAEIDRLVPGAVPAVPSSVLAELDHLVAEGVRDAPAARALAARFVRVPSTGRGDAAILRTAIRERAPVVTADRELGRRLLHHGIGTFVPRDRHRLERRAPPPEPAARRARRRANR